MPGDIYKTSPLVVFWNALGRKVADLLARRAHDVTVTIFIREGQVRNVRFDESVKPEDLVNK